MKDSEKKVKAQQSPRKRLLGIRAIFLTKEKKAPIAGLPIVLAVEQTIGNNQKLLNIQAKLATNSNGYVSFKISLEMFTRNPNIYIYPLGHEALKVPMADFVKLTNGEGIQTIEIDCKTAASIGKENIPSVQQSDLIDRDFTPYFTHVQFSNSCATFASNVGNDDDTAQPVDEDCDCHKHPIKHDPSKYCSALIPGIMPEECIDTYQLDKNGEMLPVRVTNNYPAIKAQSGTINVYESCFSPDGYSLGELSYSTTLAPCESVKIAIENWFRKDKSVRSESTSRSETLENEVIRTKSVQEFIKSKLTEHKFNIGLSAAFKIKKPPIGAALSLGYAMGTRKSTTEMVQDINETHRQLSSAYSSYNSIAIYETTQTESRDVTTRHIRNHNHCHTLTLMYFEIIQNLRVTTEHTEIRDGIFVQYPTPCFTMRDVIAHRHIFREVLLDRQLVECLDSICLDDYACDCSGETNDDGDGGGGNNNNNCPATVTELHVKVRTADKTFAGSEGNLYLLVKLNGAVQQFFIPHAPDPKYKKNKLYETTIPIPPTCVTDITQVGLELVGTDKIILANLDISYTCQEAPGNTYFLFNAGLNNLELKNAQKMLDVPVSPELPDLTPPDDPTPPAVIAEQEAKSCCENNLLQHLNCNKLFYYKILWMLEDENARAVRFQNYTISGQPLIDKIENAPLGVIGDWVAFAEAGTTPQIPIDPDTNTTTIHAPTGSLFSEAILGQCGSCETIDDSVFWDWTGKTCPDSAPDITTGGLSQFQAAGLTPFNFANSLLSLQALSNLSASASLGSITQSAIGQSIAGIPAIPKDVIDSLTTLLQTGQASNSDPDYQAAVQDLIDKLGDLKAIYELIDKIGGND